MHRLVDLDMKAVGLSVEPLFTGELEAFEKWDWFVFTSMNGVDSFLKPIMPFIKMQMQGRFPASILLALVLGRRKSFSSLAYVRN